MGGGGILGTVASLALAASGAPIAKLYGAENIERYVRQYGRSRRRGNSLADKPHEHKREIARRLRQEARNAERQNARAARYGVPGGLTRRGNPA